MAEKIPEKIRSSHLIALFRLAARRARSFLSLGSTDIFRMETKLRSSVTSDGYGYTYTIIMIMIITIIMIIMIMIIIIIITIIIITIIIIIIIMPI